MAFVVLAALAAAGWWQALQPRAPAGVGVAQPSERSRATLGSVASEAVGAGAPVSNDLAAVLALDTAFARGKALHALAARSAPARLDELIAQLAGLADVALRADGLSVFYARYAAADPRAALQSLRAQALGHDRYPLLQELFEDWASRDAEAALAALHTLDDAREIQAAGDGILLAHVRPQVLIDEDVLARLPAAFQPGPALARRLAAAAVHTPVAAAVQAIALSDPLLRRSALHAIGEAWALSDPLAALDFVASIGDSAQRWHLEHTLIERWVALDPEGLVAAVEARIPHRWAGRILHLAIGEIAATDPARALEIVAARPAWRREALEREAYSVWAAEDFDVAIADARSRVSGTRRAAVLAQMVYRRAERAPLATLQWALRQDPVERRALLEQALWAAVRTDVEVAAGFLSGLEALPEREANLNRFVGAIAERDPQAAIGLLDRLEPQRRQHSVGQVAHYFAYADRDAALEWAATLPESERKTAVARIVGAWARQDPLAAAAFAAGAESPASLLDAVVQSYAHVDPGGALDWLSAFDRHRGETHQALATLAKIWAARAPRAAADALVSRGYETREQAFVNIMQQWADRDPAAAAGWLAKRGDPGAQLVEQIAPRWAQQDIDGALAWAHALSGEEGDAASSALIRFTDVLSADQALRLARSIHDDSTRVSALYTIAKRHTAVPAEELRRIAAVVDDDLVDYLERAIAQREGAPQPPPRR